MDERLDGPALRHRCPTLLLGRQARQNVSGGLFFVAVAVPQQLAQDCDDAGAFHRSHPAWEAGHVENDLARVDFGLRRCAKFSGIALQSVERVATLLLQ